MFCWIISDNNKVFNKVTDRIDRISDFKVLTLDSNSIQNIQTRFFPPTNVNTIVIYECIVHGFGNFKNTVWLQASEICAADLVTDRIAYGNGPQLSPKKRCFL